MEFDSELDQNQILVQISPRDFLFTDRTKWYKKTDEKRASFKTSKFMSEYW